MCTYEISDRLTCYEVRDDHHAHYNGVGNGIYEHKFCFTCRSPVCNDSTHAKVELHPVLRVPKKSANKKRWQEFIVIYNKIGIHNERLRRH
jgi:hypothetical protein